MLEHYIKYRKCWNGFTRQLLTNCNNLDFFAVWLKNLIYILYSFLKKKKLNIKNTFLGERYVSKCNV